MTTAMQIEALVLLEEHVLAKHAVPALELWQALHLVCHLGGGCLAVAALVGCLCRELWEEALDWRKAKLLQGHLLQTFVPQPVWKNP